MINWPAVICHGDSPELLLVNNESDWIREQQAQGCIYDKADRLIDTSGRVFFLDNCINGQVLTEDSGNILPLVEFLGLVKAHVAQTGACCVAKLYAADFNEAFKIIASTQD